MGEVARRTAGYLLRRLQRNHELGDHQFKPMPSIGKHCYELRFDDDAERKSWRVIYRIDKDAIVVVHRFEKTTTKTPKKDRDLAIQRLKEYDNEQKQ